MHLIKNHNYISIYSLNSYIFIVYECISKKVVNNNSMIYHKLKRLQNNPLEFITIFCSSSRIT